MEKFREYLIKKFLDWETKENKIRTLNDFAGYLGVKRNLLSMWMNGTRRPGPGTLSILANKLGLEVYEALDMETPDPKLFFINQHWEELPGDVKKKIADEAGKYVSKHAPVDE